MALTKIKMARLQGDLRQWDVARQVGVSESYVSKIETGRVKPDKHLLERIAAVLKVPLERILEENPRRQQNQDKPANLHEERY